MPRQTTPTTTRRSSPQQRQGSTSLRKPPTVCHLPLPFPALAGRLGHGRAGVLYEVGDHVEEVAALFVDAPLVPAAGAAIHDLQHALQLALAPQVLAHGP